MRRRSGIFSPLRWLSIFLILAALILMALQLVRYSRIRANFPPGMRIAGIPAGGLDRQQAAQRLLEAYSVPIELIYNDAVIQLQPAVVDFQLDLDSMLSAADLQRSQNLFWQDYWDYLWGRERTGSEVPLRASISEPRLRDYLKNEIAKRYDQPPTSAQPVVGTVNFIPGKQGTSLDVDNSIVPIENALNSLRSRQVVLPLERTEPLRPAFQNVQVLLKQTIDLAGYDGLAGVYLFDLQTAQELHFAYNNGAEVPVNPDIAFTASSIIKVPIMVSTYRRMGDEQDPESAKLLADMIEKSGNETADWLMDREIDDSRGPLLVTEDMRAIGLENTFLAGYFSLGSPLLASIQTPANQRADISTDPDLYSQTTPSDIGMLLTDIYQCAETGGGSLPAVFAGEITQVECQEMVTHLINNKLPSLLTAGIPEGTLIAHKHGWVSVNGIINTIGDAGIIYSPGGDYVLVTFLYHPTQLVWDPSTALIEDLSKAVYNYYNLPE